MPAGNERNDGVADQRLLSDDEAGKLGLEGSGQFGDFGGVDARFFGDHDPPWRIRLFRAGRTLLAELREILTHEVAFTAGNEALVRGVERGLLVGLDHLAVGAQGNVLPRPQWRRVVLRLTGDGLAGHVDPLGALGCRPAAGSPAVGPVAAGTSATGTGPGAGTRASPGAVAIAVAVAVAITVAA